LSRVRIAAWQHLEGRRGFEVARLEPRADGGWRIDGHSTGEDEGLAWGWHYALEVDATWATRSLAAEGFSEDGPWAMQLSADDGSWTVNGAQAPEFAGCADVDMVSTVLTNTLAVRRLDLQVEGSGTLDAVWIGTPAGRELERMPQRYERLGIRAYRFSVIDGDFEADLEIDEFGLVVTYPGLAQRVA
jgi:hypothetical protein